MKTKQRTDRWRAKRLSLLLTAIMLATGLFGDDVKPPSATDAKPNHSRLIHPGADGKLVYVADAWGNTIPDFSNCGYAGGGVSEDAVGTTLTSVNQYTPATLPPTLRAARNWCAAAPAATR